MYQALTYLKSWNTFSEDIPIARVLSNKDICKFSDIVEIQGQSECVTEKNFLTEKK